MTDEQRAAAEELARRKWNRNCESFVEESVYIEDRDSQQLAVPFTLWDGQKKALNDFVNERLNIVLKARQLGLTWLALAYAVWCMIFNIGFQVVALSKTEDDAKELVRRVVFILKHLPTWLALEDTRDNLTKQTRYRWRSTTLTVEILHNEISMFRSKPAAADSGRSLTANLLILDEWAFQQWAREIWAAAYPTINRPSGGKVIGLSTAKRLTLFQDIWKKATLKINTFNRIFLSWRTDPRRTDAWYDQTKKDLPHSYKAEYPNTPEEAFEAAEGAAFPEFSYDVHVCKPFLIPDHWYKWRSVDNGYTDPFAWYWFAINEQGTVFIYREYTRDEKDQRIIYTDQAKEVIKRSMEQNIFFTVAGHDAWNTHHRDSSNKTLIDYYIEGGVTNFLRAETDRALRKSTWHEYLKPYFDAVAQKLTAKVQIFEPDDKFPGYGCPKLIETIQQLVNDEKDNEKVAECHIDHWYDSAGYGLISNHTKSSSIKPGQQKPNKPHALQSEEQSTGHMTW